MSTTVSFKIDLEHKESVDEFFEGFQKQDENKGDSFLRLINEFRNIRNTKFTDQEYVPPNVKDALDKVNCDFLSYEDDGFVCREQFFKKKKSVFLGFTPVDVIKGCSACILAKQQIRQKEIDKQLQRESIKKLQQFMKNLTQISKSGLEFKSYLCTRGYETGNLVYSTNGVTINCPELYDDLDEIDGANVSIHDYCLQRINPETREKPCEFLATLDQVQELSKDFWEKVQAEIGDMPDLLAHSRSPPEPPIETDKKIIEADFSEVEEND